MQVTAYYSTIALCFQQAQTEPNPGQSPGCPYTYTRVHVDSYTPSQYRDMPLYRLYYTATVTAFTAIYTLQKATVCDLPNFAYLHKTTLPSSTSRCQHCNAVATCVIRVSLCRS